MKSGLPVWVQEHHDISDNEIVNQLTSTVPIDLVFSEDVFGKADKDTRDIRITKNSEETMTVMLR